MFQKLIICYNLISKQTHNVTLKKKILGPSGSAIQMHVRAGKPQEKKISPVQNRMKKT